MRNALKIAAAVFTVAAVSAAATETLANSPATIPFIPTGISQSASSVGFADSDVYGMNADDVNHTFDLMAANGVRTVRIIIPWAGVEGTQGSFNWGQVDTVVGAANARHMSVVGAIVATPAWAVAPGAIPISSPPASPAAYGDFAGAVAAHYRGRVDACESGTSRTPCWRGPPARKAPSPPSTPTCSKPRTRRSRPPIGAPW